QRVVASNNTRWRPAALTVEHLMPGDDDPVHDDRCRGDRSRPWNDGCDGARSAILLRQPDLEVGGAVLAEGLARLTRLCVHRDEADGERSLDDGLRAGLAGSGVGVAIERHTATRRGVWHPCGRDLRVVHPQLLASRGVEGKQLVHRRTAVDGIADFERSQLRSVLFRNVARVEGPDALEVLDVFGRDLGKLRIPLRALAAAIGAPLALVRRIRGIFEESICSHVWEL